METIDFDSHGVRCEAWYLTARSAGLTTDAGRPCVVMAHGFGTTRDSGLLPFAERFADVGCDVLLFDYRGFGGSDGEPRQDVDHRRHREDYHAALAAVRARPDVDPSRVVLWGTSYSGGHVVAVAAADARVAAVVSQGAAMDGLAAMTGRGAPPRDPSEPRERVTTKARVLVPAVVRDLAHRATGRPPVRIPFLGASGSGALMTGPGAVEFATITGPTFRNEWCARGVLRIALNRPVRVARRVRCPVLLVVAEHDEIAPPPAMHEVARLVGARAETVTFGCRHFDLYTGDVLARSLDAQAGFLARVLS